MGDGDREDPGRLVKGQLEVRWGMGRGTLREAEEPEEDEWYQQVRPGGVVS
jgi:hypothetical protein